MSQKSIYIIVIVCLFLMTTMTTKAQRRNDAIPQPKVLEEMMLQEKKSGRLDDAPYIAYLVDSLGYTMKVDSAQIRLMDK